MVLSEYDLLFMVNTSMLETPLSIFLLHKFTIFTPKNEI